jgi:mRNA-decapping enzyme subunit 2
MSLHEFGLQLFTYCEPLQPLKSQYKQLYDEFSAYKNKVPTCGCILLNEACDKLLLVCNWKRTTWSFPKGKVNENEDAAVGAMREVYEEIGYRPVVDPEENITLVSDSGQLTTMFIVPGLPEDFAYTPKARKEISEVRFFYLENPLPNEKFNFNKYKTPLKAWIKKYKQQQKSGGKKKNNLKSDLVNVEKSIPLTDSVASLFATTTNGQADALASLFGSNESFPNKQNGLTDSVASLFGTTSTTSTKQPKQIKVLQKAGSPNSVGTPPNQAASGDISNKKFSLNVNNVFD